MRKTSRYSYYIQCMITYFTMVTGPCPINLVYCEKHNHKLTVTSFGIRLYNLATSFVPLTFRSLSLFASI